MAAIEPNTARAAVVGPADRVAGDDAQPLASGLDLERLPGDAGLVLAVLRSICPSEADAEDVLSASIEIAFRRQGELRDNAAQRAWLLRIATREAFRLSRRIGRFVRLGGVAEPPSDVAVEDRVVVGDALRKLPPKARAAVVLHYVVGLSVSECAKDLGTSPNTVKTQLRTGLARLREELGR